jgi:hypothetical protein
MYYRLRGNIYEEIWAPSFDKWAYTSDQGWMYFKVAIAECRFIGD